MHADKIAVLVIAPLEAEKRDVSYSRLDREPQFNVIAKVGRFADAVAACSELRPQLILLDFAVADEGEERHMITPLVSIAPLVAISSPTLPKIVSIIAETGTFRLLQRGEEPDVLRQAMFDTWAQCAKPIAVDMDQTMEVHTLLHESEERPQPEPEQPVIVDGKYRLVQKLGQGGTAIVYLAQELSSHQTVALKILYSTLSSNSESRLRFEREVKLLHSLDHPNIARMLGWGFMQSGEPYAAMEYVTGVPLELILHRRGAVPEDSVVRIGMQICSGLQAAHDKKIVHRDLKPANIFVTETGDIKILDFGIARSFDANVVPLTADGDTIGTTNYMSPEQCMASPLDGRTDIYALGCVMFELLTGTMAFDGPDIQWIMMMHCNGAPDWQRLDGKAGDGLKSIIRKALARDAAKRYQCAFDMQAALKDLVAAP